MLCESKIMYGIELWGLSEAQWKELDGFKTGKYLQKFTGYT